MQQFVVEKEGDFLDKLARGIIRHRRLVLALFLIAALVSAVLFLGVDVNYSMADYLPEDAESTKALELLQSEFSSAVPNSRVLVPGLSLTEALEMKSRIAALDGVEGVMWLDDAADLKTPVELMDSSLVEQYYKDGDALFSVTIADGKEKDTVDALYELIGEDGAITGDAAYSAWSQNAVVSEVLGAVIIVVPIIIVILLLTTTSWIAPLLFLLTIGVAVLINMGTNIVFGEISYITQSVSPILQLAVSMDYAIFLLGSFDRYRRETKNVEDAMAKAIVHSFSSIAASALTTVFGFLALIFMRFQIGSDLGINLVKGVILSYVSVMLFLPSLTLACVKLLDRTTHKRIVPELKGVGRGLVKIRIPALILVVLLVVPAFLGQSRTDFVYGTGAPDNESNYGADTERINAQFGEETAVVLMVPRGDPGAETLLHESLCEIDHVTSVLSYAGTVGVVPDAFLSDEVVSQFYSDNWARFVIYTDTPSEGGGAFETVEAIRAAADALYDESYSCGESVNLYDIKEVVTGDSGKVNLIAIAFIALTLLVTFKSLTLPVILLFVIESAIWINLSVPYFTGTPLVYLGYLVMNTVQLGATIDYAILMTDGYLKNRRLMPCRQAVEGTLSENFVSVMTSGLVLASAGLCLYLTSSMEIVSVLGALLARGTLLSLASVLLALPALLMLFDPLTARLTRKSGFLPKVKEDSK